MTRTNQPSLLTDDLAGIGRQKQAAAPRRAGRYAVYAVLILVLGAVVTWRLSARQGAAPVDDATARRAEQIREQAAVPPPPTYEAPAPEPTGPEPQVARRRPPQ